MGGIIIKKKSSRIGPKKQKLEQPTNRQSWIYIKLDALYFIIHTLFMGRCSVNKHDELVNEMFINTLPTSLLPSLHTECHATVCTTSAGKTAVVYLCWGVNDLLRLRKIILLTRTLTFEVIHSSEAIS